MSGWLAGLGWNKANPAFNYVEVETGLGNILWQYPTYE